MARGGEKAELSGLCMRPRIRRIDPKAPSEVIPITFDFSALTASIDSVASVSIAVKSGTDPAAGSMLFGSHVLNGSLVQQLVQAGVDQAVYLLRADIVKGNEKYSEACYLPVVELT